MHRLIRFSLIAALAGMLAACATVNDLDETPPPMGRFLFGHNIVTENNPEVGPASRTAKPGEWQAALRKAMNDRFSRYDGDQYYHISVAVLGYALAQPGIPIVASPKSVLMADVYVFNDRDGGKPINEKPKRFTVFEEGHEVLVGSGLTRTAEEQMESLSRNLAKSVHDWMLKNPEWFGDASKMDPATTSPGRPIQPLKPQPSR